MTRYLRLAARVGILVGTFLLLRQLSDRNLRIVTGTVLVAVFAAWLHDEIRRRRRNPLQAHVKWISRSGAVIDFWCPPSLLLDLDFTALDFTALDDWAREN